MTHTPGDLLTYRRGSGTGTGRITEVHTHEGVVTAVHIQTKQGRKRISSSDFVETNSLTRFSAKPGQRVRVVRKNGNLYEGKLRSWDELFVKITIDAGAVGYQSLVEELEGVYLMEEE